MDERQMICDRCRRAVPWPQIKYLPKGKDQRIALCDECRAKFTAGDTDDKKKAKSAAKKSYICARCRYKFTLDPSGVTNLKCPYCGKDDKIVENKVPSADRLIKSAGEER
jgi:DNA-directed RNA polymerase subunit RPC12/RpoP